MEVQDLSYRHHRHAPYLFHNQSFCLEPGKLHALHGKNGTGKSILLHLLSGEIPADGILEGGFSNKGSIILVNQKFDQMIADQFSFDENLQFACMGRRPSLFSRLQAPNLFFEALDRFQIDRHIPVQRLSGGQRQILSLLMVLQKKVDILLLDEPTATLDEENAELVFAFLHVLIKSGMTILVVCHDRELISRHVTGKEILLKKSVEGSSIIESETP